MLCIWFYFFASLFGQTLLSTLCPELCKCGRISVTCIGNNTSKLPFQLLPNNTKKLEARNFHISEIMHDDIRHLTELEILRLSNCKIQTISSNAFNSMPNLQTLSLNDNKISSLPTSAFLGSNIKSLNLAGNAITFLSRWAFNEMRSLKILYLQSNRITGVDTRSFSTLTSLKTLYLRDNRLKATIVQKKIITSLETLDLGENSLLEEVIQSSSFSSFPNLRNLYLDSGFSKNSKIREGELRNGIFRGLTKLQRLDLADNAIRSLETAVFKDLISLQNLNLEKNSIDQLKNEHFSHLSQLNILTLSYNKLSTLPANLFTNLTKLKELYLRYNEINSIPENLFDNLMYLGTVDLSHNQLKTILVNTISVLNIKQAGILSDVGEKWYWLSYNPWRCDCRLKMLKSYINDQSGFPYDQSILRVRCAEPTILFDRPLIQVPDRELSCNTAMIINFEPTNNINAWTGQTVEMRCQAREAENLIVEWSTPAGVVYPVPISDTNYLNTIAKPSKIEVTPSGILRIINASPIDSGVYTCTARTHASKTDESIHVNITDAPPISDESNAQCSPCECSKYQIQSVKGRYLAGSLVIQWTPMELVHSEYFVLYRAFGSKPTAVRINKGNEFTIKDVKSATHYIVCVQMLNQPCADMINIDQCVDIITDQINPDITRSILLLIAGFCVGAALGLMCCFISVCCHKPAKKTQRDKNYVMTDPDLAAKMYLRDGSAAQLDTLNHKRPKENIISFTNSC